MASLLNLLFYLVKKCFQNVYNTQQLNRYHRNVELTDHLVQQFYILSHKKSMNPFSQVRLNPKSMTE